MQCEFSAKVRSSIDEWKTTPWRQIDVEGMDIELKKFAKDIRGLDKEMRPWHVEFLSLIGNIKNLSSLLSNPQTESDHASSRQQ